MAADLTPEDADKGEAGTSLAPAASGAAGIDPFLAKANEAPAAAATVRPFYARALDYSAHAAMIVGLIGFAWTVSDHVVKHQPAAQPQPAKVADATTAAPKPAEAPKVEAPKVDEIGELRHANQKMAAEIRTLHANLDALRTTVVRERGGDDTRALATSIDGLKSSLATARSETAAAVAQLSGRVDKLQREVRAPQVAEHAARPEHTAAVDTTSTGSIPAPPARVVPTPPAKPTTLASAETDEAKPAAVSGWVVRDVYQGVALIEGRRGQMEVVPGVSIPGAGVVKSIDRHGSGWTVTTSKGQIAYEAPAREAGPRDYGRGPSERDYYSRRYGY